MVDTGAAAAFKRRVYEILEVNSPSDEGARWANRAIVGLIVINLTSVVLETVPSFADRGPLFGAVEFVTVALFAVEYAARVWVADLHGWMRRHGPVAARLAYMVSASAIIDMLAILPGLIGTMSGLFDLNVLVVFRLLRFLKLARYSPGMRSLVNAISTERRALLASGVLMMGLILSAASLMHWLEGTVQPDKLGSIPLAMYWAVTTLTTVGYGDVVPLTGPGKMLAGVVMLFGFCMFALPVGIIATAFAREIHSRDFVVSWGMVARVPLFAELKASEIAEVTRLLSTQTVEAGAIVTAAGEPGHTMYLISSGTVEVQLPGGKVRLSEGSFFGELAVLRRSPRSADVIAVTRCSLMLLDAEDLHYLMAKRPSIAKHIRSVARERLGREALTPAGDIVAEEIAQGQRIDG